MLPLIALVVIFPSVPMPSPLPGYSVTCSVPGTKQDASNVKLLVSGQQPNRVAEVRGYASAGKHPVSSSRMPEASAVNGLGLIDSVYVRNSDFRTSLGLYIKGTVYDRIELWIGEVSQRDNRIRTSHGRCRLDRVL